VGGTCGGSLSGSTYTTAAITSDCTVTASFSELPPTTYTGNAVRGAQVAQSVQLQHKRSLKIRQPRFTVTADSGYEVDTVGGTCGGSLSGSTYTTAAITSDCTVTAFILGVAANYLYGNSVLRAQVAQSLRLQHKRSLKIRQPRLRSRLTAGMRWIRWVARAVDPCQGRRTRQQLLHRIAPSLHHFRSCRQLPIR
jgi:hypothetical protein